MKMLLSSSLILLLALPQGNYHAANGQTLKELSGKKKAQVVKLAPDLEELLVQDEEDVLRAMTGKPLAEIRRERLARLGQNAATKSNQSGKSRYGVQLPAAEILPETPQSFIVETTNNVPSVVLAEKVARLGGKIQQKHAETGLMVIEAPRTAIRQLAADTGISYVSPDRQIMATGHVENTTGAALVRNLISGTTLTGKNIGVAVIDSGMDQFHSLFTQPSGLTNLLVRQDFTGKNVFDDPYGHGSHVSSIIVGSPTLATGAYKGIAPEARLINLGVLDDKGYGSASSVIAAIDWCISNRSNFNIRVINLSLGTAAKDSYLNDPICKAARRAHNAGIVVVASAGNAGKSATGQKLYGGINSPGIDPSVITVGAVNTFGTDARSDDIVASYSSRGPTRGYVTINGVRKYDNLIKPDLVAPGNKIVAACSNGRQVTGGNNIASTYPALKTGSGKTAATQVMYQSGTSMAAPVVAGAIALMLQANPKLTPSLVKAILMYSAQPLKKHNLFEQGAGELNVDGALRLTRLVKSTLPSSNGTALLTASLPSAQTSVIAGETCAWGQGVITNYCFLYGSNLMTQWQGMYGNGVILSDSTFISQLSLTRNTSLVTSGVSNSRGAVSIGSSGVVLSDGVIVADGVLLGTGVLVADGVIVADGVVVSDGVVLSDGTTRADGSLRSSSNGVVLGDNTAGMVAP